MKTKSLLIWKIRLAFGSAFLILVVVCTISYHNTIVSRESDRWVRHTHEVLENLQDSLFAMQSIESSYRGFVLTGSEECLDSFHAGILRVQRDETILRALTVDNPAQQHQFPVLKSLMDQNIQFDEMVMRLRGAKLRDAAADVNHVNQGERIMLEYQGVIREMQDEEQRLLGLRDGDAKLRVARSKTYLILETALGLLLALSAGWTVQRDTSRRELAEVALRDSEEKYRMLLDGVQDYAIFMLDTKGMVVNWNTGAERIQGYNAREIIGHNFSRFFTPEDIQRGRPEEALRITTASGRFDTEQWCVRKDGSRFWANVVITVVRNSSGELLGYSKVTRDISERREAETRYRGLLEAAPDAMVINNSAGHILLVNAEAERLFGYSRDELVGQPVEILVPERFRGEYQQHRQGYTAHPGVRLMGEGLELRGLRKDQTEFPIEISLSPLESPEGILVTAAIRDITERKKSEDNLVKTVGELKRSNDELQQFAYVASHDLQEPLRMVASYTQLLAKRYKGRLDSDADEFIAYAVDGSNRMQGMIQDLLAYSRAGSSGKALLGISTENALENALTNLRTTIAENGATVTHDSLPVITADKTQLTQVFQNLVGNAIKYRSAEVPHVHVSAAKNDGNIWIFSVRDNGLGIESQYFDRIFVLFQRLHGRDERTGTGIGLAICKKILERLGGRIWVESQLEKGSTFYFSLPQGEVN